jgi:hypothetical protein
MHAGDRRKRTPADRRETTLAEPSAARPRADQKLTNR